MGSGGYEMQQNGVARCLRADDVGGLSVRGAGFEKGKTGAILTRISMPISPQTF